jgi:hypothetical protein
LCLRWEPEIAFERMASRLLTAATISHLKQKFPRSNYPSTPEWAEAVITEIKSFLLAATPWKDLPEPLRKIALECSVKASIQDYKEDFEADLNLRERLDAMIHRQVKHLIQLKAMKQMLRQTSIEREDEQPRKIAGRSTSRR